MIVRHLSRLIEMPNNKTNAHDRQIRLKCKWRESEIRTVVINPENCDFSAVKQRLSNDFGFPVSLKYQDMDGDLIILNSQNDFDDLVRSEVANTINVVVTSSTSIDVKSNTSGNLSSVATVEAASSTCVPGDPDALTYKSKLTFTGDVKSFPGGQGDDGNAKHSSNSKFTKSPQTQPKTSSPHWKDVDTPLTSPGNSLNSGLLVKAITSSNAESAINASLPHNEHTPIMSRHRKTQNAGSSTMPSTTQGVGIRWKRGEMLGQGAFGVVYLGLNLSSGELMAVKQVTKDEVSSKELASLENEINLLRGLNHRNIVRYIGADMNDGTLSIFLEYVPGGSLKALVDKFGKLEDSVAKTYTRQLLMGLEYLHTNGIAHRDIKGANCLVGNDGVCKLADFGNSKHWRNSGGSPNNKDNNASNPYGIASINVQSASGDIKGTPSWMAPEVIREQGSNQISWRKADVWSLACTTLEIVTGKPPWSQFNNSVTILYHLACQETTPEYPTDASVELASFLSLCLQRDPSKRPDTTSLLLHPFVSSNINANPNLGKPVLSGARGNLGLNSPSSRPRNESESNSALERSIVSYASPANRQSARHLHPGWYSSHDNAVDRPHSVSTDMSSSHTTSKNSRVRSNSNLHANLDGFTPSNARDLPHAPKTSSPKTQVNESRVIDEDARRELLVPVIIDREMDDRIDLDSSTDSSEQNIALRLSHSTEKHAFNMPSNYHNNNVAPLTSGRSSIVPSYNVPQLDHSMYFSKAIKKSSSVPNEASLLVQSDDQGQPDETEIETSASSFKSFDDDKSFTSKLTMSSEEKHDPESSHPKPEQEHKRATEERRLRKDAEEMPNATQSSDDLRRNARPVNEDTSLDKLPVQITMQPRSTDIALNTFQHSNATTGNNSLLHPKPDLTKKPIILNDLVAPQKRIGNAVPAALISADKEKNAAPSADAQPFNGAINQNAELNREELNLININTMALKPQRSGLAQLKLSPRSPRSRLLGNMNKIGDSADNAEEDVAYGSPRFRSDSIMSHNSNISYDSDQLEGFQQKVAIRPPLGQIPPLERPYNLSIGAVSADFSPARKLSDLEDLSISSSNTGPGSMSPNSPLLKLRKQSASKRLKELNRTLSNSSLGSELSGSSLLAANDGNASDATQSGAYANRSQTLGSSMSLVDLSSVEQSVFPGAPLQPLSSPQLTALRKGTYSNVHTAQHMNAEISPASRVTGRRLPRQSPITISRSDSHNSDLSRMASRANEPIAERAVRWGSTSDIRNDTQDANNEHDLSATASAADAAEDASAGILYQNDDNDSFDSLTLDGNRIDNVGVKEKYNPGLRIMIPQNRTMDASPHLKSVEPLVAASPIANRKATKRSPTNQQYSSQFKSPSASEHLRERSKNDVDGLHGNSQLAAFENPAMGKRLRQRKGPLSAHARMTESVRESERGKSTGMLSGNLSIPSAKKRESDERDLYHGASHHILEEEASNGVFIDDSEHVDIAHVPGFSTAPALLSKRQAEPNATRLNAPMRQRGEALSKEKELAANKSINTYYQQIGNRSGMAAELAKSRIGSEETVTNGGSYLPSPVRVSKKTERYVAVPDKIELKGGDVKGKRLLASEYPSDKVDMSDEGSKQSLESSESFLKVKSRLDKQVEGGHVNSTSHALSMKLASANLVSSHGASKKIDALEKNDDSFEHGKDDQSLLELVAWKHHQVLSEHKGAITRLRCPRGTDLLISSSIDGTVRIWGNDPNRSTSLAVLDAGVFNLPSGSADHRNIGRGMSAAQSEETHLSKDAVLSGEDTYRANVKINNVWAEANCASIWAACSDYALRVWSGADGKPVRYLRGHEDLITCLEGMAVSSGAGGLANHADNLEEEQVQTEIGSNVIATGSADSTVRIWDARSKKAQVFLLKGHSDTVSCVRWGEGGRSVITAGKDKTIRIWDTRAGRLRVMMEKHFGAVNSLRAIPEHFGCCAVGDTGDAAINNTSKAAVFASGGRDCVINLWTDTGNCVGSSSSHRQGVQYLSDINLMHHHASSRSDSSKGSRGRIIPTIFSIGGEGVIKLWDLKRLKPISDIHVQGLDAAHSSKEFSDIAKLSSPPLVKGVWAHHNIVSAHGKEGNLCAWKSDADGTWTPKALACHGSLCTDLLSTNSFVASASKSGSIFRWAPLR